jgi:hypothetical protein
MLDVHVAKETVYFVIPFQNCHKDFFLFFVMNYPNLPIII